MLEMFLEQYACNVLLNAYNVHPNKQTYIENWGFQMRLE